MTKPTPKPKQPTTDERVKSTTKASGVPERVEDLATAYKVAQVFARQKMADEAAERERNVSAKRQAARRKPRREE